MKYKKIISFILIGVFCTFSLSKPVIQAQTPEQPPPPSINYLFSTWAKLSLMGYTQSEIESLLIDTVDPTLLQRVKHRIRLNVLNKLNRLNIKYEFDNSTTQHDLRLVREKVRTEVRFAGLENDPHIRRMIHQRFGIPINRI